MANESLNLPSSSLTEIEKIIDGYHILDKNVSLDRISQLIGMNKTSLSPNHPFLKDIGVITGGRTKSVTELGKDLGRAIHHQQHQDVRRYWRQIINDSDFLSRLITTVKIKKGLSPEALTSHILYVANVPKNKSNKTGANAIVDLLLKAGKLVEDNGQLVVTHAESPSSDEKNNASVPDKASGKAEIVQPLREPSARVPELPVRASDSNRLIPSIHIDVQIHISADADAEQIDHIFASMAKHLNELGRS